MTATKPHQQGPDENVSDEKWAEIRLLTLMNDDFMSLALENDIPCVEEMLRVVLKKDDLCVTEAVTQRYFEGFTRSVRLDIYAKDSQGTLYNIEIQQADEGADPRRPRFHGAMMDAHALKAGEDFKKLPERYVIFITRNDVLKLRRLIYTIHKYIDGDLLPFDDGSHIIYINGAAEDDGTELWKLVHDLKCADPAKMFFPRLAARVRFLKEDDKGVKIVSDYFKKLQEQAVKEAEERKQESLALKLIRRGKDTLEEIAEICDLALQRVQQLAKVA